VPSGVWAAEEYEKLPLYDADTPDQPMAAFYCHQQDGRLCAGWVGCHDMINNLGLRVGASMGQLSVEEYQAAVEYTTPVPLWSSGTEACAHGLARIADPEPKAHKVIDKLTRKGVAHVEEVT
jgi:hypothetical protein